MNPIIILFFVSDCIIVIAMFCYGYQEEIISWMERKNFKVKKIKGPKIKNFPKETFERLAKSSGILLNHKEESNDH